MLVVSPCFLRSGWGVHRPQKKFFHSLVLIASLFLSLFAASSSMIAEASQSDFECHLPSHGEVKPRFLYINDKERPVTLMTSRRIPHRLLTTVLSIFLRQQLGYVNVVMVYEDSFHPDDVLTAIGYGSNDLFELPDDFLPKAMTNLELWVPPGYNDKNYVPIGADTYLGVVGGLGWFFPAEVIDKYDLIDHWRIFTRPSSAAIRVFSRTSEELSELIPQMIDADTQTFYCSDLRCKDGMFTPNICVKNNCAVLFASYFNLSSILIDQITNANLYVRVAWLGRNLNKEFIRRNLNISGQRSILFFHYTPDVLIQPFNLTSVAFPSCSEKLQVFEDTHRFCMYEMHRFHKYIWNGLRTADGYLYESLQRVSVTGETYNRLITTYNENEGHSLEQIACLWMLKNQRVWKMWQSGDTKPFLYLIGLFPVTATSEKRKFLAPGNVPSFHMAIDAINTNTTILPDHIVQSIIINTECEPDIVMLEFIKIIKFSTQNGKYSKLIGIVGPACSDTVEPIAGVSKYFKMPIISYGAEGAIFSDREQYPYFFRTIPENKIFRYVYLQLFKKLKWARVASLTEDGHRYSEYLTPLQDILQDNGITFNMRKYPQERKSLNMTQYLTDLKKQRYTIIIGDFYQDIARVVMCEAYHQKMTGHQGYVWFLPRWFPDDWYDVDSWNRGGSNPVPCTTQEMLHGIQGHMSLSYKFYADDDQVTLENITTKEWKTRYRDKLQLYHIPESDYAGFTYDAVWTYGLALDQLFKEDMSYTSNLRSVNTTERFIYYINNTNFSGVSGHINFTHGPSRVTDIVIWQFSNKSYNDVGWFYPDPTEQTWGRLDLHMEQLRWPLKVLPRDGGKECIIESFRLMMGEGTSCITAIIILCTISFGSLAALLILLVIILKQRYESKLRQMEELWRDQSIFKKFEGWEIPRSKVVINRKLGEGQFGTVYGGECLMDNQGWEAVAVKTLKVGSTITEKLDFLSEAEMMKNFSHDNIVKLLGVCTESEPIYTVMEFMLYGDLRTYLLDRRNLVNEKSRNEDDEVSNRRLTQMALDVAKALHYLAEMKYVHRDVACRNCLVNTHRNVKLADYGMTRRLNEKNYYKFTRKGMLPVRWMAPESLGDGVFTTCSDMWSYGVFLYEVITFGTFPFQGLNNTQVVDRVKSGQTLPIPQDIEPALECLLQSCWQQAPSKRVTASLVIIHLQNSPRLISPSLEAPQSAVNIENPQGCEVRVVDRSRKLSLALNNRAMSQGVGPTPSCATGGRKRSMSGNMMLALPPLTTSLSEDGMLSSTLDALNLNQTVFEEHGGDMGEDPLLPPSQYISSTRFLSLSYKDIEREREALMRRQAESNCAIVQRELWTDITPV